VLVGEDEFLSVPPPRKTTDPRIKELELALSEVFLRATGARYKHQGVKDTQALKRILAHGASVEEAVARFERGLSEKKWKETKTFAQLDSKWNDLLAYNENSGFATEGPITASTYVF
jgi:hypothetical protein